MNAFADAPKHKNGQNPFLGVLAALAAREGTLNAATEKACIDVAEKYAKENGLSFTPTMKGVMRLAEQADKMHRMHMDAMAQRERDEAQVELSGYDLDTGFQA